MAKMSISKAWEETTAIVARDGRLITSVALALVVLPQLVVGIVSPPVPGAVTPFGRILGIVAALIALLGQLALVRLAVGPSTSVGEAITHAARRFPSALGAFAILLCALALVVIPITMVLLNVGWLDAPAEGEPLPRSFVRYALLIMILGLALGAKLMMLMPVASSEKVGPLTILKRSWGLTKGHYWPLLGLELLLFLTALIILFAAQILGGIIAEVMGGAIVPFSLSALIIALFLGLAQAGFMVVVTMMVSRLYLQLSGKSVAGVPSTGT
jgi:hypothetical protein